MATKQRAKAKKKTSARPARRTARPKGRARPRAARAAKARSRAARPAAVTPSPIGLLSQHMDYTSHALDDVKRFYTEILGFGRFEHEPKFNYLTVTTGPSSSLGFMPPMPGPPEQWRPPREPAIYFLVQDVDRLHRGLTAKGVAFQQEPTDMPWGHRVAMLRDPEGRTVCLAQRARR